MEYRQLGASGLKVPALSFGAGTFGGRGPLFGAWGQTDATEARRLIDICLDAGITLFDTADVYSEGASEEVLGAAIAGRRDRVLVSTKVGLPTGEEPNRAGTSRHYLHHAVENSLRRLGTDYIDLQQLHAFDAATPIEETLATLDNLVRAGKLRYIGVSNFSGWQLMKSLGIAAREGHQRYVAHQVYYSLIGRDYEWELMPLALQEKVGALVWSPLGWGRLTGKIRRNTPVPPGSRLHETAQFAPLVSDSHLFDVIDALDEIATETDKSVPQIALNWLLQRPSVASVIIGARNEAQLKENLGAINWQLSSEQMRRLDVASATTPPYPYYPYHRMAGFMQLNPPAI